MNEYLPLATLLRLLAVLALVLSPHIAHLPLWESGFIAALIVWRGLMAWKQWRLPPTWVKVLLTTLAFGGVVASLGRIIGQTGGTALLCAMAALKLLELKGRRDVMFLLFLMYFVLFTHFLFSQELWTILYLLACALAITAVLIECQHLGALAPKHTLRKGGSMVAQALPLMLLMFVLFPRIPGPLWGLPADAGASSRTGLSDSMAPGDISSLIESGEVAFRVEFLDALPPPSARYWRGPVFDHFDGRRWDQGFPTMMPPTAAPPLEPSGRAIDYVMTLEPQRRRWLLALDMPAPQVLPAGTFLDRDATLVSQKPIIDRKRYTLRSHVDYRLEPGLDERARARYLRLPQGYDARARALAQSWRDESPDDAAIVNAALRMFREQPFVYTLQPPPLGRDTIDDFLFRTRRGFCEHYSSAFTVLMRAAGIPARVVTGYQGGALNEIGDYYVVRQSDAHAWSEVWLEGEGWRRVDPTAAVSPLRIEQGIGEAMSAFEGLPAHLSARAQLRIYFEARWDWINAQWNGLVLGYGPELQREFLSRFGLGELRQMILALTIAGTAALAIAGLLTLRRFAPAHPDDPALRQWRRLRRKLAREGFEQRSDEGPQDFAERVAAALPQRAEEVRHLARLYIRSRYLHEPDRARLDALTRAVRAFRA